jgi:hypothetical protein
VKIFLPAYLFFVYENTSITPQRKLELDVHESVHRDTIIKVTNKMLLYKVRVKQPHYRPGQALRVPEG